MKANDMKRQLILVASAIGLVVNVPAWAGFSQGNSVTMGGKPVFSIQAGADGFSPEHRAWITQDRLDNALVLSSDQGPSAVSVDGENIFLGGRFVASADSNSAALEGVSARTLAQRWADSIRAFLADTNQTGTYLAELTGKNAINAQVAVAERRIFAPPGTVLPVAFATDINSETLSAGAVVEGTLTQDVLFGQYALPANSRVLGTVVEPAPGQYVISFNSLRTPNGTLVPIAATMTGGYIASNLAPHPVATEEMPYGTRLTYMGAVHTVCRMPATIGIGTLGGGTERLAFRRGTNLVIVAGTPMSVVLDNPTQVAVVLRNSM